MLNIINFILKKLIKIILNIQPIYYNMDIEYIDKEIKNAKRRIIELEILKSDKIRYEKIKKEQSKEKNSFFRTVSS